MFKDISVEDGEERSFICRNESMSSGDGESLFKTAKNKIVNVSDKNVKKFRDFIKDFSDTEDGIDLMKNDGKKSDLNEKEFFRTCNEATIKKFQSNVHQTKPFLRNCDNVNIKEDKSSDDSNVDLDKTLSICDQYKIQPEHEECNNFDDSFDEVVRNLDLSDIIACENSSNVSIGGLYNEQNMSGFQRRCDTSVASESFMETMQQHNVADSSPLITKFEMDKENGINSPLSKSYESVKCHQLNNSPNGSVSHQIPKSTTHYSSTLLMDSRNSNILVRRNVIALNVPRSNATISYEICDKIYPKPGMFSKIRSDFHDHLVSLKDFFRGRLTKSVPAFIDYGYVDSFIVNFHNCDKIVFACNGQTMDVGDGGLLLPDEHGFVGIKQIIKSFLSLPHVDPKLITVDWISNCYKMVLWKLLSVDHQLKNKLASDWLSLHHIFLQLKYRYDKEIDKAKRPALRRILEMDDHSGNTMILFLLSFKVKDNDVSEILLSDGWYYIPGIFDQQLKQLALDNQLKIGMKLIISNAVLLGVDRPLTLPCKSFPPNCGLQLFGNSTRRARFYSKLGFQHGLSAFPISLTSLSAYGGIASLVRVVINRIYPIQFVETVVISEENKVIRKFRSAKAEHAVKSTYEKEKEKIYEKTLENLFRKVNDSSEKKCNISVECLSSGEEILEYINTSNDQDAAHADLSTEQREILKNHQNDMLADAVEEHCPPRVVVSCLTILVSGSANIDILNRKKTLLTIWKPSESVVSFLKEGTALKIYGPKVTNSRISPYSLNNCNFVLKTTSQTKVERDNDIHANLIDKIFHPRQTLMMSEIFAFFSSASSPCEFDCYGTTAAIGKIQKNCGDYQYVVLFNSDNFDDTILLIQVPGTLEEKCLNTVFNFGNYVKCYNLQWIKPNDGIKRAFVQGYFGDYSDAQYTKAQWDFCKRKNDIHERILSIFPQFEFHSSVTQIIARFNQRDARSSAASIRRNLPFTTSTPKRLGIRNTNMVVGRNAKSTSPMISRSNVFIRDGRESSNGSEHIIDEHSTIADSVKLRKRSSTMKDDHILSKRKL